MDVPHKLLVGLIGAGIQRSLSPAMHEEEAGQQGMRLHYQLIDLDTVGLDTSALPGLLRAARAMGFAGLNITYPCKQAVIEHLDDLSPDARDIGAVNTVVIRDGRLTGHNTDAWGWAWGFRRALQQADLSCVVLLGAGGAGSAVAHALLRMGTGELRIVDTDASRAAALAARLQAGFPAPRVSMQADTAAALQGCSGLVHATPAGMAKMPGLPMDPALLQPHMWLSEVVYVPLDTPLLLAARSRGCATMDGGTMAVGQAVGAFGLFTGRQADPARMERHFRSLVTGAGV
jgi:shikimate dehydrogenase